MKSHKTVLIIEDDLEIISVYYQILIDAGFNVLKALTASEGLKSIKSKRPDLILLDIMLPGGFNGLELLEIIKHDVKLKSIPVLMLTNLDRTRKLAQSLGCSEYLIKVNVGIDELVNKVKKYV